MSQHGLLSLTGTSRSRWSTSNFIPCAANSSTLKFEHLLVARLRERRFRTTIGGSPWCCQLICRHQAKTSIREETTTLSSDFRHFRETSNRSRYSNQISERRLAMRSLIYRPKWVVVLTSVVAAVISFASGETLSVFLQGQHLAGHMLSCLQRFYPSRCFGLGS